MVLFNFPRARDLRDQSDLGVQHDAPQEDRFSHDRVSQVRGKHSSATRGLHRTSCKTLSVMCVPRLYFQAAGATGDMDLSTVDSSGIRWSSVTNVSILQSFVFCRNL